MGFQCFFCFHFCFVLFSWFIFCELCVSLHREYLAVFKKTVQIHEVFLQRLSSHPVFSKDRNFRIFLEYDQNVSHIFFFLFLLHLDKSNFLLDCFVSGHMTWMGADQEELTLRFYPVQTFQIQALPHSNVCSVLKLLGLINVYQKHYLIGTYFEITILLPF